MDLRAKGTEYRMNFGCELLRGLLRVHIPRIPCGKEARRFGDRLSK